MNRNLIFGIIIALLLVAAGAWYFFGARGNGSAVSAPELSFSAGSPSGQESVSPPQVPAGWRKYENAQYGFSLFVPPELSVNTFDEGGGAHTFTFEDAKLEKGFQIFVVPYSGTAISPERFLKDAPSGVMKERIDVIIGGVTAAAFFGEHTLMGETREVWFLHGDYLFEVTTYKPLDSWLAEIMSTWRFLK